ncbi:MAG: hypothetical protein ACLGIV_06090 [Actinomycetes bacterium]
MDLHVRQHERFTRREWRVERVGWVVMTAFVLSGVLGLLGPGPLSWTTAESSNGVVAVDYQRVVHHEADEALTLTFTPEAVQDQQVTLELTGDWLEGIELQGISPAPSSEQLTRDGAVLEWDVDQPGSLEVTVTYRPQRYAALDADLAVRQDRLTLSQLVLP